MFSRALAAMIVGAACLVGAGTADAQQTNAYDRCRDEATRRNIAGAGLSDFMNQCMQQQMQQPASGSMDRKASYDRCRQEGVTRGLTGDALYNAVGDCLQSSGTAGGSMAGTYNQCRTEARSRSLSGAALDQYLNSCVTQ